MKSWDDAERFVSPTWVTIHLIAEHPVVLLVRWTVMVKTLTPAVEFSRREVVEINGASACPCLHAELNRPAADVL
jgi:hypothetical protein